MNDPTVNGRARPVCSQPARFATVTRRASVMLAALATMAALTGCGSGFDGTYAEIPTSQKELNAVAIAWDPPSETEDGSTLTDLAGYRIHYGLRSGDYQYVVEVHDPAATAVWLPLPWKGTWYISAKAYRQNGFESDLAEEIMYENRNL